MLLRTTKDTLSNKEIIDLIKAHEGAPVERMDKLWKYYKAKNTKIVNQRPPDPNNPDNKTPVGYGRKIVTTFTGYAYRPRYITYKTDEEPSATNYLDLIKGTFNLNREHIKTSRAGRNTAIFGMAYEIVYVDGVATDAELPVKAEPKFFSVDPREMILLYDQQPEPEKKIAVRYYAMNTARTEFNVEVYYMDKVETYTLIKPGAATVTSGVSDWVLTRVADFPNFFDDIPVVAYYFGDEMLGIIEPVLDLIDDYDVLVSGSLDEFDRFAHAYLRLVKMNLTDPIKDKEPGAIRRKLQEIKRRRVFENLRAADDVTFLTKDIPSEYIKFMTDLVRKEIHVQSHVPDFADKTFASEISGVAVQRLLFDFENVVSSAEADFDVGLGERLELMNTIYKKAGREVGDPLGITINHRRNLPTDLKERSDIAKVMSDTGFSDWLVAEIMPDPVIPDVQAELDRQEEDRQKELDRELTLAEADEGELEE